MKSKQTKAVIFANMVLGGMAILFTLAFFFLLYKKYIIHSSFNLKFGAIATAGLLFYIIALYMRNNWKVNIAIFTFSCMIAAYSVEFILFVHSNTLFSSIEIDKRNRLEVLEDLRTEGIDAWPHVIPYLFIESNGLFSDNKRIFPLGGVSQKTIVYCNESGQFGIFESDEHGFNNPKGLYNKSAMQYVLVGDSFTLGNCVRPGEDIAGQLRNMGISALNLGNGGNGPLIELAELKEYVEPFQPKVVLWVYFEGNDLFELEKEVKSSILMRYLEDNYSQNLIEQQGNIDTALMNYVEVQWKKELDRPENKIRNLNMPFLMHQQKIKEHKQKVFTLWHLRKRIGLLNISNQPQKSDPRRVTSYKTQLPLFSEILAIANKRTSSWGGKFYFVYLPNMERYANDNFNGSFFNRDDVLDIVHKRGIPLIDFHKVLSKHPEPLSLVPFLGAHYNAQGYKLIAELIVSQLRKDGLISGE